MRKFVMVGTIAGMMLASSATAQIVRPPESGTWRETRSTIPNHTFSYDLDTLDVGERYVTAWIVVPFDNQSSGLDHMIYKVAILCNQNLYGTMNEYKTLYKSWRTSSGEEFQREITQSLLSPVVIQGYTWRASLELCVRQQLPTKIRDEDLIGSPTEAAMSLRRPS